MTPLDVFGFTVAAFFGLAVGLIVLGLLLGAAYIIAAALARRIVKG